MNSRIFPFRISDLSDPLVGHKQIHYQKYALLRMFLSTPEDPFKQMDPPVGHEKASTFFLFSDNTQQGTVSSEKLNKYF